MNDVWTWNFGEINKVMRGQLRETVNGVQVGVDLSQFTTVTWTAKRTETGTAFSGLPLAVIPDVNQTTESASSGKGWFTYTTDATSALIPASTGSGHYLSFIATDSGGHPHTFPLNRRNEQTYARLVVQ